MERLQPGITPLAMTGPINFFISSSVTLHLVSPVTRCAAAIIHFRICLSIDSLNSTRNEESGLPYMTGDVSPARNLTTFCYCICPTASWGKS